MPLSKRVYKQLELTVFIVSGELTFDEQIRALREYYEGEPTRNAIWDFRAITGSRITSEELRQIIAFTKWYEDRRPGGKTALVASTQLDFGLGRMSHALAEREGLPWQIRVFRSIEEALEWIEG